MYSINYSFFHTELCAFDTKFTYFTLSATFSPENINTFPPSNMSNPVTYSAKSAKYSPREKSFFLFVFTSFFICDKIFR